MRLDDYTKEMMDENSFIDMSYIYLQEKGDEANLYDIIDKFKEVGNYSDEEIEQRVLQFYTDLNTDGRFLSTDQSIWGLRDWYSVDEISDKVAPTIHKIELASEEANDDTGAELFEEADMQDQSFDQDKALTDGDKEDFETPLNDSEDENLGEALDETVDDEMEYDDTDKLEDSYEDDNNEDGDDP